MAANSAVRKNHLEGALRTSRNEVIRLNTAAADDIEALDVNFTALANFINALGLRVDANGNIYQVPPETEQEGE